MLLIITRRSLFNAMAMKQCRECREVKNLFEFYKHQQMTDGYLNKCKSCVKSRVKKHRSENIEKTRAYDRQRGGLPHRVSARKAYARTEAHKLSCRKANLKYIKNNPKKREAQIKVGNAIKSGKLIKQPCEVCGSTKRIHAHHDDYSKPLEVRWLCPKHHSEWHKYNTPIEG